VRFLADECCDAGLVGVLRTQGHDVLFVVEDMGGATDAAILDRAFVENRIILTEDKDFGELVYRLGRPAHGIVLFRFDPRDRAAKIGRILALIRADGDRLFGNFVVIEVDRARIRPLR
jgi:predicted nuclease of predicted toxin-antitoxin system